MLKEPFVVHKRIGQFSSVYAFLNQSCQQNSFSDPDEQNTELYTQ